jgi:hypothetical protein
MANYKCTASCFVEEWTVMVAFTCNICGAENEVEQFASEPATCRCGSNVRIRALMHLLSIEIFGESFPLSEFPRLKSIRGLGLSDKACYAELLAEKFDYANTFLDRDPRFDLSHPPAEWAGAFDFLLAADVLEHVAPPVERAMEAACRLLKPHGFFGITIFCNASDRMREHFPDLHEYRVVPLGGANVLINRRRDGQLEITDDLIFHGGSGATLEMREFGATALRQKLAQAGFCEVEFLDANVPGHGILFDHDTSQPLIARKGSFCLQKGARSEMVAAWRTARDRAGILDRQARLAAVGAAGQEAGRGPEVPLAALLPKPGAG